MTRFGVAARYLLLASTFLLPAGSLLHAQDKPRPNARILISYMETSDSPRARRKMPASRRLPKREENNGELTSFLRDFQVQCPEVPVTELEETAAYFLTVTLTHPGGLLTRRYSVTLTRNSGDVLYASTVRRFSTAAKAACKIIGQDAGVSPPKPKIPPES